jgi:hypothetical protein
MFIRRVGAWSVFKFSIILYIIFFLITFVFCVVGYLIVVGSGLAGAQGKQSGELLQIFGVSGGVALVVLFFIGLFSSIFYAILNAVGALIYNIIAWMTGGIELSLEEREE